MISDTPRQGGGEGVEKGQILEDIKSLHHRWINLLFPNYISSLNASKNMMPIT